MDRDQLCWAIDCAAAFVLAACVGISGALLRDAGISQFEAPAILAGMGLAYVAGFAALRWAGGGPGAAVLPAFTPRSFEAYLPEAMLLDDVLDGAAGDSRVVKLFGSRPGIADTPAPADNGEDDAQERMVAALADIRAALGYTASVRNR